MKVPRVSIGLPVYNGDKYLRFSLDSILQQEYADFELIISDNASTDETPRICREYAAQDKRIRYFRNAYNLGATRNFNRVFELARGQFFKWATHDDEIHTSLVKRCLETMDRSTNSVVLVYSKTAIIDEAGRVLHISPDTIRTSMRPFRQLASVIYNRKYAHPLWGLVRTEYLRKTRLMGNFEADHVLLAELALLGQIVEIPEVLYRLRRHVGNAMEVNRTPRQLLAWHDPSARPMNPVLPRWARWDLEYYRAIRHISLSAIDRLLSYGIVRPTLIWRWLLLQTGPARHRLGLRRYKPHGTITFGAAATDDSDEIDHPSAEAACSNGCMAAPALNNDEQH